MLMLHGSTTAAERWDAGAQMRPPNSGVFFLLRWGRVQQACHQLGHADLVVHQVAMVVGMAASVCRVDEGTPLVPAPLMANRSTQASMVHHPASKRAWCKPQTVPNSAGRPRIGVGPVRRCKEVPEGYRPEC